MSDLAPSPTISNIKVTTFDAGKVGLGIRLSWLNEAGAQLSATRCGLTAKRIHSDLHAATLIGEAARRCFLIGFIRGLYDKAGLDE